MVLNIYAELPGKNGTAASRRPTLPAPVGAPTTMLETLAIVALDDVLLHEDADTARAEPLSQAMVRDGVQRHPVILTRTPDGVLVQLDGRNRIKALQHLGYPHVAAQIVPYDDPDAVHLSAWTHLTHLPPLASLHATAVWDALAAEPIAPAQAATLLAQERAVAVLVGADQEVVAVRSSLGLLSRVAVLRQLMEAYAMPAVRVPVPETASLVASARAELARTPCANTAVVFAPLRRADVITLVVELGMTLPAGLTRHVLACGRVLNVNVPLALLRADLPVAEKTARLQARLARQCYRVYAESTLVYEEE